MSVARAKTFHPFSELLPELKQLIGEAVSDKADLLHLALANKQMFGLLNMEIKSRFLAANKIIDIRGSTTGTFFTTQEGELYVCGTNHYGELGIFGYGINAPPRRVTLLQKGLLTKVDVVSVISKAVRTFVLKSDGRVFACGSNKWGPLFAGSRNAYRYFLQLDNLPPIKKMTMHNSSLYLLGYDGQLFACGDNSRGQLGLGGLQDRNRVMIVPRLMDIVDIAESGEGVLCLRADGRVFAFGDNTDGQLGLPERTIYEMPTLIESLKDIDKIWSIYKGAVFRDKSGKIYVCGSNSHGRLGVGSDELIISISVPFRRQENIEEVNCVGNSVFYITKDRRVLGCGDNTDGRLGLGDTRDRNVPDLIPGLAGVLGVHALDNAVCFFLQQSPLHVCGSDVNRLPGMESTVSPTLRPVPVPWAIGITKKGMHGQNLFTLLSSSGAVHGWGHNGAFALGLPERFYVSPTKIELPHVKAFLSNCTTVDLILLAHKGADDYHDECFNMALDRMPRLRYWYEIAEILPLLRLSRFESCDFLQALYPGYQVLIDSLAGHHSHATLEVYKAYAQLLILWCEIQSDMQSDPYVLKRFAEFINQLAETQEDRDEAVRHRREDKYERDTDFVTFFKPRSVVRYKEFLIRLDDIPKKYLRLAAEALVDYIVVPDQDLRKRKAEDEPEDASKLKKPKK